MMESLKRIEAVYKPIVCLSLGMLEIKQTGKSEKFGEICADLATEYSEKFFTESIKGIDDNSNADFEIGGFKPMIHSIFRYRMRRQKRDFSQAKISDLRNEFSKNPLLLSEFILIGGYYKDYYHQIANNKEMKEKLYSVIDYLTKQQNAGIIESRFYIKMFDEYEKGFNGYFS